MKKSKHTFAIIGLLAVTLSGCSLFPGPTVRRRSSKEEVESSMVESISSETESSRYSSKSSSKSSSKTSSSSSFKPSSSSMQESSEMAAPSSYEIEDEYLQVIPHVWSEGEAEYNSDGKEYIPLTDVSTGKVGVKIALLNYTVESDASEGTMIDDDGKISPQGSSNSIITYRIKAPKEGAYQLVMTGRCSSSGVDHNLDYINRLDIYLNGYEVDIRGDRNPLTLEMSEFVAAPKMMLTGKEDIIKIVSANYRIVFDRDSYLVFAEH